MRLTSGICCRRAIKRKKQFEYRRNCSNRNDGMKLNALKWEHCKCQQWMGWFASDVSPIFSCWNVIVTVFLRLQLVDEDDSLLRVLDVISGRRSVVFIWKNHWNIKLVPCLTAIKTQNVSVLQWEIKVQPSSKKQQICLATPNTKSKARKREKVVKMCEKEITVNDRLEFHCVFVQNPFGAQQSHTRKEKCWLINY